MSDVIQFFLKMAAGFDERAVEPPYLVQFGIERARLSDARKKAEGLVTQLYKHRNFKNGSHAAQFSIADAVLANGHTDQRIQQMLALLIVHLATDSQQKLDTIAAGADKVGYVMSLSDNSLRAMEQTDGTDEDFESVASGMLAEGNSPFKFKFVALSSAIS
ncbi:hypothetical protein [Nitrospirillum sp. BR 11163]|uniref:hypothetical protein n=1 Tax=Nitrospirillum sp. BR 11163 TaxID=3104323 RepID=UPI002AFED649|nr:hypothetical protein [Nitrospirillum sp. BR 11163]MEA1674001.1 hypothetical protein [Nitrospirillum sp. BR 11163]